MATNMFTIIRTQTAGIILAIVLAGISFSLLAPAASAQVANSSVVSQLQAQIAALMAQIAGMQSGVNTTPAIEVFAVGSLVQPTANVRVRSLSGTTGVILGTATPGSVGKVEAGPVKQGGVNWYRITFKTNLSGWVAGTWLTKVNNQLVDVNTFVKTNNGSDNKMEPGLEDASIVNIKVLPASFDRYANKVVLQFTPTEVNGEDLPWVAFENISLWANGWNIRNVNAGDMGLWRKVGNSYQITVFSGNQKISPNRPYNFVLAVTSDVDTPVGDRWNVTVPAKGAVIWSQANGHMTNAAAMTTYPIEFIKSDEEEDQVYVEVIKTEATVIANTFVNSESGEFKIKFEVTAGDSDVYLSGVPNGLDYFGRPFSEDSFVNFSIVNGDGRVLDGYKLEGYTTTLTTTANDVVAGPGTIHFISEGETEEFTFVVKYKPATGMPGAYRVQLEGPLRYSPDKSFNDGKPNKTADINEKDSLTPQLYLIGGARSTAKIDSFTVTPSKIQAGSGVPVTFAWKSSGTAYCYITENLNGVTNNLGLSDLKTQGTVTYYVPDKYTNGTEVPYVLNCQDASTQKDTLVQATTKVSLVSEMPFVTITGITTGATPIISGNSEERISKLGFSIAGPSGDKVYASGDIAPVNGKWSHKVTAKLQEGNHEVIVYMENKEVARKPFTVGGQTPIIMCISGVKKYIEGTKLQQIIVGGQTTVIADASYVCRKGKWVIEGSLPNSPITSSSTPRITSIVASPSGQYVATVVLGRPTTTRSVMGPVNLGTISWGDRVTENIFGLVTRNEMVVTKNHTYRTPGTYTVTVKGLSGATASKTVVVGTSGSGTGSSTLPMIRPSGFGGSSSTSTGIVRGASVDVFAEISSTLTTISEMLKTIK